MTTEPVLAAIDIGGTSIKSALFTRELHRAADFRSPTPQGHGPDAVLDAVGAAADELLSRARELTGVAPVSLGVASLGLVDERHGRVLYSAAVGWRNVELARWLQLRTLIPVAVGHDIRAAAQAEMTQGTAQGRRSMLFLAIGTGIGAALCFGGHPLPGEHARAGELGHLPVRPGGRRCGCGAHGCLEAYASAAAIAQAGSVAAGRPVTAAEVAAAAGAREAWAVGVWQDAVDALADGLVCAAVLSDPALIVIGGGLSLAGPVLFDPLRAAFGQRYPFADPAPIMPAALGDNAALIGAALLARELIPRSGPVG